MDKKKAIAYLSLAMLVLPAVLGAEGILQLPDQPAVGGLPDIWTIIVNIIKFLWPIFIGFFIFMAIWAGFLFITANGEPGKIQTAKSAVIWAIVGLILGLLSFSIPDIIRNVILPPAPAQQILGPPQPGTGACMGQNGCISGLTEQNCEDPNGVNGVYGGDGSACE
jgi:hypothetical protein